MKQNLNTQPSDKKKKERKKKEKPMNPYKKNIAIVQLIYDLQMDLIKALKNS